MSFTLIASLSLLPIKALEEMSSLFKIIRSDSIRKKIVATCDIPAGAILVNELPIVYISKEQEDEEKNIAQERKTGVHRTIWAMYDAFKQLPSEEQEKYLSLYSESGQWADTCELALSKLEGSNLNVGEFLAVYRVFYCNSGVCNNCQAVYHLSARWSYSCRPNCSWTVESVNSMRVGMRTITDVKCGEVLTICSDEGFLLNPIFERRSRFLRLNKFVCNCERCKNPADDTRRFVCYSMAAKSSTRCPGYHCVCQPAQDDKPYLMPCSVCRINPSPTWEQSMLQLEKQELAKIRVSDLNKGFLHHVDGSRKKDIFIMNIADHLKEDSALLSPATPLSLPLHYSALYFLEIKMAMALKDEVHMLRCARQLMSLYDQFYSFPSSTHYMSLSFVGTVVSLVGTVDTLLLARDAYMQAHRIFQMYYGKKDPTLPKSIMSLLALLKEKGHSVLTALDLHCCALCGASPSHSAAVTLSKCSKCMEVQYCGRECQVIHWKLHKEHCHPSTNK